jgi:hypothetical protein
MACFSSAFLSRGIEIMKAWFYGLVAVGLIGNVTEAKAQTQAAATVGGAIQELKFEFKPDGKNIGGPQEYEVTDTAIKALTGKTFWLISDGSITFVDPKSEGVAATQDQALVGAALQKLKFEFVKPKGKVIGGDQEYKTTDKTIEFLKEKKRFWIIGDGSIAFKKPK